MLAAWDLAGYELHFSDTNLDHGGTNDDDFSGVAYLPSTGSFFIIDNAANSNDGRIHEFK